VLLSAGPIIVTTVIGLVVALVQTMLHLQEQTLPFGVKLAGAAAVLFLTRDWTSDALIAFTREAFRYALR